MLPSIVRSDGTPAVDHDGATSTLVALFADLARDEPDDRTRKWLIEEARYAYEAAVTPRALRGRFGGVTVDAACPDREAALFALEASVALYEVADDPRYLEHARTAADALLSYMFAYRIATFELPSDAATHGISTLGGSLVSPENQHLDPLPLSAALIRFGLYADDCVAVRAGQASLAWCLDGRWAMDEPDGIKQSEQFNHTRWHYNAFFTERGSFRRGMPCFGRVDSEHGWPQVAPASSFLDLGHVVIDWPTGRAAPVAGMRASVDRDRSGWKIRLERDKHHTTPESTPVLVKVLRPPVLESLLLRSDGFETAVNWPATLETIRVVATGLVVVVERAR